MPRRLEPEELALWQRAMADVRPLAEPAARPPAPPGPPPPAPPPRPATPPRPPRSPAAETLDSGWDRRLSRGRARPDRIVDLHGLSRQQARETLITAIERAERQAERLILVITGKGATPGPEPADLADGRPIRGAIRADLPRWLGEAHLSARIAAVRRAHPRHGGDGAVYLVLKRHRPMR